MTPDCDGTTTGPERAYCDACVARLVRRESADDVLARRLAQYVGDGIPDDLKGVPMA